MTLAFSKSARCASSPAAKAFPSLTFSSAKTLWVPPLATVGFASTGAGCASCPGAGALAACAGSADELDVGAGSVLGGAGAGVGAAGGGEPPQADAKNNRHTPVRIRIAAG